jgi:hypothetical protein
MRHRAGILALVCAFLPARAGQAQAPAPDEDGAAREVAEGEKLARAGLFAESIARFKAAESLAPHARHDCLIALSYLRLKKLGQADLFMQRCAARASGADPAPPWLVSMSADVKKAIGAADLAPVSIAVLPAEAAARARVTCSAFGPDEVFAPTTIQLPPGEHTVRSEADGFTPSEKTIAVSSRQPLAIELTHEPVAAPEPVSAPPPAAPRRAAPPTTAGVAAGPEAAPAGRGPWPYITLGVAGAALVGGVAMHIKALDTKDEAESSLDRFNDLANDYESQRTFTYGLYTVAIISGAVGAWMWFHGAPDDGAGGFQAAAAATQDGAFVTLGWRR